MKISRSQWWLDIMTKARLLNLVQPLSHLSLYSPCLHVHYVSNPRGMGVLKWTGAIQRGNYGIQLFTA